MMPKIVSKSHDPHVLPMENLHNTKAEDLKRSIGVVPAKDPPKVKLVNARNPRVQELGKFLRTSFL